MLLGESEHGLQTTVLAPGRAGAVAALPLLVVAGVALMLGLAGVRSVSSSVTRPSARGGLSSLPLAAQGVVSAALGGDSGVYRIGRLGGGYQAVNPAQSLRARFDRLGVRVRSGGGWLGLRLDGVGYGGSLAAVGLLAPLARDNRVVYARPGLSEWYTNGPLGLEQGFTLAKAPAGDAGRPLTLSLALSGDMRASVDENGRGLTLAVPRSSSLRYDDLLMTDARGRTLHSWISLQAGRVLLHVDARGARYPLTIDPLIQQGPKLTANKGKGEFGFSVALSSNGNTALIGARGDNKGVGAAWVFTRSEGKWTQQGEKLTGKEEIGSGEFGSNVALSSEGNTALIGGQEDHSDAGAAWVFTLSGGVWSQQGPKLVGGKEETGAGYFGYSVALSSNGNIALVGGPLDNKNAGAVWVFVREKESWSQQGAKLTGKEEIGEGRFGWKVALSSEGNTALIGGYGDNKNAGAAWVFTSSEGKWSQQGTKLTGGKEEVGEGYFGYSVALSSNGNTALVGGPVDNKTVGAVWVFVREKESWSQQGAKLTGKEEISEGYFGESMSLSSNGNIALVGGWGDNKNVGAAWILTSSEGKWTQQGSKLTGKEESGEGKFGFKVALSSEGNTALIGGYKDNEGIGGAWVFTSSEGKWTQQGEKLTGKEEAGAAGFGVSVALSSDGNTALIGGSIDNKNAGAVWVFTRSEGKWTQQGPKLTGGAEESNPGHFGSSVALSSDGNTALIGAPDDNKNAGAVWVFTRSEGKWTQQGPKLTNGESVTAEFGVSVALSSDGNTALIGGSEYHRNEGGAWVFTRSEGKWTQQGPVLVNTEICSESNAADFGISVALSSDGNTALIGGTTCAFVGAAWVFTRSEGKWKQQGTKITVSTEGFGPGFGRSVALSSDGSTALISAPFNTESHGAVWVFTRSQGKWTQQGSKLTVGAEESNPGDFGYDVALSSDGNTALIGASEDNKVVGAVWVFTRSEGKWTQQGSKLTGVAEEVGSGSFGGAVALSSDASTALIGGGADNSSVGAAWVLVPGFSSEESYGCENPAEPNLHWDCAPGKVNVATGDLVESQADLSVGGRGPGLRLDRTYNSQLAAGQSSAGAFGYGWTGLYSAHLVVDEAADTATVYQDNGSTVVFSITASKEYVGIGPWVQAKLVKEGTGYVFTLPDQTKLEFNSSGQLTKEVDRNGNAITLAYKENQLETATDGDSRKLTFSYNKSGQVEGVKDPMGHTAKYTYENGNLTSATVPGESWKFEYNASHELTKLADGRGGATTMEYDSFDRLVSEVDPLKRERKLKYAAAAGTETTITEPNGSTTVAQFNSLGLPTKTTRASGTSIAATTTYEYQSLYYNLITVTDPGSHTTNYAYNAAGDLISKVNAGGSEQKWTYDSKHNIETETTPKGETTTIKRNANGDPEVVERPLSSETQKVEYEYNEKGDLTEEIDPLKRATKYTYDAAGDREIETDPEGDERKWKYNGDSQEIEETSPRKFVTKTERDERGRPTTINDPLGHTMKYTYDADGNIEAETDGNGHTTKYTYDADNELTKTEKPNKTIIEKGYDNSGELTSQTDGNGATRKYVRNQLEEITEEIDPLKRVTKKEYDAAGNMTKAEDPEKHTATYTYTPTNQIEEISYSTGKPATVKYGYDKDNEATTMSDGTGETITTYDALERVSETKNGAGKAVEYEYNLANEPLKIVYPNGKSVIRAYDKDGRLEKVTDWNERETKFAYNPDSQLKAIVYPSGSKDEDAFAYNEADQMTQVKMAKAASSLATLAYTRDGDGQVKSTTTTGLPGPATSEDTYDENNRLTESAGSGYAYDAANNPTKLEGKSAYAYNAADELEKGPEATYTYDSDGRRSETKPTKGPTTSYTYDQAGNLIGVKRPEEKPLPEINDSYTYNGNNLRQNQTINGTTTHLTWDTAEPLPIVLVDEANSFIYGPGNLPIEQISTAKKTLYLHHDQQGSTRLLTGETGSTEAAYTYNPYGTTLEHTGTPMTSLQYDAQYTNTDTGLIYLRARTYDPQTAQFLSVDPALEATGEPYTYTEDNPMNQADPTGNLPPEEQEEFQEDLRELRNFGSRLGAIGAITVGIGVCGAALSVVLASTVLGAPVAGVVAAASTAIVVVGLSFTVVGSVAIIGAKIGAEIMENGLSNPFAGLTNPFIGGFMVAPGQ